MLAESRRVEGLELSLFMGSRGLGLDSERGNFKLLGHIFLALSTFWGPVVEEES